MIEKLNLSLPLNSLSLGQVSFNLVRELYKMGISCVIFPKGPVDLSAYQIDKKLGLYIERSINERYLRFDRKTPSLTLWHIGGSEDRVGDKNVLFSFHETSEPTSSEVNLLKQQDFTFFSSSYSVDNFKNNGIENVDYVPLGLDEDFKKDEERTISEDVKHWVLCGKFEKRKKHKQIIDCWIKKYANNHDHQLTLCITNPFYDQNKLQEMYHIIFNGKPKPFNINVLPRLKTNEEMNQLYNSADFDLGGLSGGEGWNIPSFTMTALGKWSLILNATAHKNWATYENSILIEPEGMEVCYDGVFFHPEQPFNQGNFYSISNETIIASMEAVEKKFGYANQKGLELQNMTYRQTVEKLLKKVEEI